MREGSRRALRTQGDPSRGFEQRVASRRRESLGIVTPGGCTGNSCRFRCWRFPRGTSSVWRWQRASHVVDRRPASVSFRNCSYLGMCLRGLNSEEEFQCNANTPDALAPRPKVSTFARRSVDPVSRMRRVSACAAIPPAMTRWVVRERKLCRLVRSRRAEPSLPWISPCSRCGHFASVHDLVQVDLTQTVEYPGSCS